MKLDHETTRQRVDFVQNGVCWNCVGRMKCDNIYEVDNKDKRLQHEYKDYDWHLKDDGRHFKEISDIVETEDGIQTSIDDWIQSINDGRRQVNDRRR